MVLAYSYASATLRFPFMLDNGVDDDDYLLETEFKRNSCPHNIENFEKSKNLYFQYSEFCLLLLFIVKFVDFSMLSARRVSLFVVYIVCRFQFKLSSHFLFRL